MPPYATRCFPPRLKVAGVGGGQEELRGVKLGTPLEVDGVKQVLESGRQTAVWLAFTPTADGKYMTRHLGVGSSVHDRLAFWIAASQSFQMT